MRRQCGGGKREVVRGRRKRWRKRWRKEKVKGKSRRGRRGEGEKDGKMEGWKEGSVASSLLIPSPCGLGMRLV